MKIPLRVALPLGLALGLSLLIGGFFLWQIHASVETIESAFQGGERDRGLLGKIFAGNDSVATKRLGQSEALVSLRQGEIFELKGEWKQAEEKYQTSASSGGGAPALRKLASIQLQRRKYQDAKETIATLKSENAASNDVLLLEGILALRMGQKEEARSIFLRGGETPQGLYGLSLLAIAEGDHGAAEANLTKAAASHDATMRTYADTVLKSYNEFALFPSGESIHRDTLVARALAEANECEIALTLLGAVVNQQSRYRDAWIVKGYCEFRTERLSDSLHSLERAYGLDPEKAETQYFLARTHASLGDPENAVTYLQYAIVNGFQPEKDARQLLAEYARELGNTKLALEQLKILADAPASELSAYEDYVSLAITVQDHVLDGYEAAKKALLRWPDDGESLALAARAALAAGLSEDAAKYADLALKIDPKNIDAQNVSAEIRKNRR